MSEFRNMLDRTNVRNRAVINHHGARSNDVNRQPLSRERRYSVVLQSDAKHDEQVLSVALFFSYFGIDSLRQKFMKLAAREQ